MLHRFWGVGSVSQCVAARNNVLQSECVATFCNVLHRALRIACGHNDQLIDPLLSAVCCSVLRCFVVYRTLKCMNPRLLAELG